MRWRRTAKWTGGIAAMPLGLVALLGTALAYPEPFFAYTTTQGRLSLYSDRPFDVEKGRAILTEVDRRIALSPLDTGETHAIFVSNDAWRRQIFMNVAAGAGGVNFYPLTRNVFTRSADINRNQLIRPNGTPAELPRTFTYYGAHEITHSLTAAYAGGPWWNRALPVWIREGYADYVGMGGHDLVKVDAMYAAYRMGDHRYDPKSGWYARHRMLVAFFLDRRGWSVERLMATRMTMEDAMREFEKGMKSSRPND